MLLAGLLDKMWSETCLEHLVLKRNRKWHIDGTHKWNNFINIIIYQTVTIVIKWLIPHLAEHLLPNISRVSTWSKAYKKRSIGDVRHALGTRKVILLVFTGKSHRNIVRMSVYLERLQQNILRTITEQPTSGRLAWCQPPDFIFHAFLRR